MQKILTCFVITSLNLALSVLSIAAPARSATVLVPEKPPPIPYAVGDQFIFDSSVKGTFTSYGGVKTPIDFHKLSFLKIVSVNGDLIKVGGWWDSFKGEPQYFLDVYYSPPGSKTTKDYPEQDLLGSDSASALAGLCGQMGLGPNDTLEDATRIYAASQWIFADFSELDRSKTSWRVCAYPAISNPFGCDVTLELNQDASQDPKGDFDSFIFWTTLHLRVSRKDHLIHELSYSGKGEALLKEVKGTLEATYTIKRLPPLSHKD